MFDRRNARAHGQLDSFGAVKRILFDKSFVRHKKQSMETAASMLRASERFVASPQLRRNTTTSLFSELQIAKAPASGPVVMAVTAVGLSTRSVSRMLKV